MTIQQHENLVMNHPTYQSFVSPNITRHLQIAGLDVHPFQSMWRVDANEQCELRNFLFDEDKYYMDSQGEIDVCFPPKLYMPAFQIRDMDILLPDYLVQREGGHYTVAIDSIYRVEACTDHRLPDALALMVLDCIRARIIKPELAIQKFMKNKFC